MSTTARDAARLLWDHARAGTVLDALPPALRPPDAAAGLAIQAEWPAASGWPQAGWKIAATSQAGQAHIRVDGPLPGRILSGQMHEPGAALPLAGNRMRVLEPEFAFRLATDLAPRDSPRGVDEVLAAVATLHPAFELPDSRYADFTVAGEAQLLADNACCGHFVIGPAAPASWRMLDLAAHTVRGTVTAADGSVRLVRDGAGRAVLGDPRLALTWLVNRLSALGLTVRAGQPLSTGTCMVPLEIRPGDCVQADFGELGEIGCRVEL